MSDRQATRMPAKQCKILVWLLILPRFQKMLLL
jgi:hypothetical protein